MVVVQLGARTLLGAPGCRGESLWKEMQRQEEM